MEVRIGIVNHTLVGRMRKNTLPHPHCQPPIRPFSFLLPVSFQTRTNIPAATLTPCSLTRYPRG